MKCHHSPSNRNNPVSRAMDLLLHSKSLMLYPEYGIARCTKCGKLIRQGKISRALENALVTCVMFCWALYLEHLDASSKDLLLMFAGVPVLFLLSYVVKFISYLPSWKEIDYEVTSENGLKHFEDANLKDRNAVDGFYGIIFGVIIFVIVRIIVRR